MSCQKCLLLVPIPNLLNKQQQQPLYRLLAHKFQKQGKQLSGAVTHRRDDDAKKMASDINYSLSNAFQIAQVLADQFQQVRSQILSEASPFQSTKFDGLEKLDQLNSPIQKINSAFHNIISLCSFDQIEKIIMENEKTLEGQLDRLVTAVKKGDEQDANLALKLSLNKMAEQSILAQVLAAKTPDSQLKEKLLEKAAKLDKLSDDLVSSTKKALETPSAVPELVKVVDEIKRTNRDLTELGKQNIIKRKEEEERIRRAEEERRRQEAERKRKEEEARLAALRKQEEERLEALRLEALRIQKEEEERKQRELEKIRAEKLAVEERERRERLALEEAERRKKEEEERRRKREERIMMEREEAERRRREEQEAKDEIYRAAQRLAERIRMAKRKLGNDYPDFTGEGKLFDLARTIGELMKKMSDAAKNNDKAEMIRIAQEIAATVKNTIHEAIEQSKNCTDKVLSDNLVRQAQSVQSFAVQLKIIAAVKAGVDGAESAKQQLVRCAEGLAGAMINTVNAAESAALRDKGRNK